MQHAKTRIRYGGLTFTTKVAEPKAKEPATPTPKAIVYDSSEFLAAARIEARQNVEAWLKGKPLSYVHAKRFAASQ